MSQRTRHLIAALGMWLLVVALLAPHAHAQDTTLSFDEYVTLLRTASAAAQRGDRLGLEDVAAELSPLQQVRLEDGATGPVDNRWLGKALEAADPDFDLIAAQLGGIINALTLPESSAPADALARLESILSNPPYADREQDVSWLSNLFDWLGRVLDSMFGQYGSSLSAGSQVTAWILGVIGVVLLVGLIVYLLLGIRRGMVGSAKQNDDPEANLTAKAALDQATDLARGGDHRTAMRFLYLSALLWLDERDMLRYDRALTNREYLERVRDNPSLRGRLAPIVETFDRVWYGHAQLSDADFAAYKAQVEALRSEVR